MADEACRVFIQASAEVDQLITDLGTSWSELLEKEDISAQQFRQTDPAKPSGSLEKEPVTVILASAGLVMAIAPALARIITVLARRPVKVTESVLIPVEDSNGQVVKDSAGNPVLTWVERARLLEPKIATGKSSVSLEGPLKLKLTLDESD